MIPPSPVMIKVGGSLLALPDLSHRMHRLMQLFGDAKTLFIIGGGTAADEIRRLDERGKIAPVNAHWDAIAAMTYNSKLLSRVFGFLPVVASKHEAQTGWKSHAAVILDCFAYLRCGEGTFCRQLPESWDVTSDSIAASVTLDWPGQQILFCKSCESVSLRLLDICDSGQLDAYMPRLLPALQNSDVQMNWLNLCADDFSIRSLQGERGMSVP